MILEFAVENFRSIKDCQVFSMIAESTKAKSENVFEVKLANGSSIRLLKTAVIYGPNASGKSNFIKAISRLVRMVSNRIEDVGRPIRGYDPFIFSPETITQPTVFELTFLFDQIKFNYKIAFKKSHIVEEGLTYYPKGQSQRIFHRSGTENELSHKVSLGKKFGNRNIEVFRNVPTLNKFGTEIPHKLLSEIYLYISSIEFNDTLGYSSNNAEIQRTAQHLFQNDHQHLFKRLEKLLQAADTKIAGIKLSQHDEQDAGFIDATSILKSLYSSSGLNSARDETMYTSSAFNANGEYIGELTRNKSTLLYETHEIFENGKEVGTKDLDFNEASEGTKALFWRGGLILEKLETGGILVFDELDNSLHPKLVKFLVKLFTNPRSNPHNAQLIFATHEVTLLDRDLFRTDQIWITEKNQFGETELYSIQDFEGVREDIPFDKWYMAGKFGGQPNIDEIESIFANE